MLSWGIEKKKFELLYNWKLSRNEAIEKINYIVSISDEIYHGTGEVAPNTRYSETPEKIESEFNNIKSFLPTEIYEKENLRVLQNLPVSNSLKFGLESAGIHYLSNKFKIKTTTLLDVPPVQSVSTCYTIPVMDISILKNFYDELDLKRFKTLKVKVNKETGFETIKHLTAITEQPLKIDANEAWNDYDDFQKFIIELKNFNIEFIEQPFPSSMVDEYKILKKTSKYEIIGDESITDHPDWNSIKDQFHGVNIKLMKTGGYLNAIHSINTAKKLNLKTMIGCMVESTLGISSAMNLAGCVDYCDLDGFFIIKNEPYHMVYEKNGYLFKR